MAARGIGAPVAAFAAQEDAAAQLRASMMGANGRIAADYAEMDALANDPEARPLLPSLGHRELPRSLSVVVHVPARRHRMPSRSDVPLFFVELPCRSPSCCS